MLTLLACVIGCAIRDCIGLQACLLPFPEGFQRPGGMLAVLDLLMAALYMITSGSLPFVGSGCIIPAPSWVLTLLACTNGCTVRDHSGLRACAVRLPQELQRSFGVLIVILS
jgi:hypothetical protein